MLLNRPRAQCLFRVTAARCFSNAEDAVDFVPTNRIDIVVSTTLD
jgi:hypothetical protein